MVEILLKDRMRPLRVINWVNIPLSRNEISLLQRLIQVHSVKCPKTPTGREVIELQWRLTCRASAGMSVGTSVRLLQLLQNSLVEGRKPSEHGWSSGQNWPSTAVRRTCSKPEQTQTSQLADEQQYVKLFFVLQMLKLNPRIKGTKTWVTIWQFQCFASSDGNIFLMGFVTLAQAYILCQHIPHTAGWNKGTCVCVQQNIQAPLCQQANSNACHTRTQTHHTPYTNTRTHIHTHTHTRTHTHAHTHIHTHKLTSVYNSRLLISTFCHVLMPNHQLHRGKKAHSGFVMHTRVYTHKRKRGYTYKRREENTASSWKLVFLPLILYLRFSPSPSCGDVGMKCLPLSCSLSVRNSLLLWQFIKTSRRLRVFRSNSDPLPFLAAVLLEQTSLCEVLSEQQNQTFSTARFKKGSIWKSFSALQGVLRWKRDFNTDLKSQDISLSTSGAPVGGKCYLLSVLNYPAVKMTDDTHQKSHDKFLSTPDAPVAGNAI